MSRTSQKSIATGNHKQTQAIVVKRPLAFYLLLSLISGHDMIARDVRDVRDVQDARDTRNAEESLDLLTAQTYLSAALQQHLGVMGSAISTDLLHVDGPRVWLRVPREDASAVIAALSQWISRDGQVSWRVLKSGGWLAALSGQDGTELFDG